MIMGEDRREGEMNGRKWRKIYSSIKNDFKRLDGILY